MCYINKHRPKHANTMYSYKFISKHVHVLQTEKWQRQLANEIPQAGLTLNFYLFKNHPHC